MNVAHKQFGDWQTPSDLASRICRRLAEDGVLPAVVIEPTCGIGRFVRAALDQWPSASISGIDIQPDHIARARRGVHPQDSGRVALEVADIFKASGAWEGLPRPMLCLGNPPWVTNSELGSLGSDNLPAKRNVDLLSGMDARTGKANFDLAEAVLLRMLGLMREGDVLAMLVKASTAQRTLLRLWKASSFATRVFRIDAKREFGADVEACLLVIDARHEDRRCEVYEAIESKRPDAWWVVEDGRLVVQETERCAGFVHTPTGCGRMWRSGVKHDASRVLELRRECCEGLVNGFGEKVEIEPDLVFPLMKSSDVANGRFAEGRCVLLPQCAPRAETADLGSAYPQTMRYLMDHANVLDARKSSIYRNRPRFAIFGIGPYTFSRWKVAVSGLYHNFLFQAVGPKDGKPVVFDDTVNLLACEDEAEARFIADHCNGQEAQHYLRSRALPGAKRPLTADLLRSLPIPETQVKVQEGLF